MAKHKELLVWQKAMELVDLVYTATRSFPKEELFGLTSQMRRSVISVPSNIAEGAARNSRKEFLQFIAVAQGSLAELETQVLIANRQSFLQMAATSNITMLIEHVAKLLTRLSQSLKR